VVWQVDVIIRDVVGRDVAETDMATMITASGERLLSIEEFMKLPDAGRPTELVRGRVVEMNPPFSYHGYVCGKVSRIIGGFAEMNDLGYSTSNDSGVITERDPDTLRGADFTFHTYARVPKGTLPKRGYVEVAPDLVVEVRSPGDSWKYILAKVAEYLNIGVVVACVLDPQRETATVYRADQPEVTLTADQLLEIPDVLPGFSVLVRRFLE
jgi:Uma2 family endonuclease